MRVVIQRVSRAKCTVDNEITGEIKKGYMILVGFKSEDTPALFEKMVDKIVHLRIFEDEQGKMNLSLLDVSGSILSISQFTLYAQCKKGRRPSFDGSAPANIAKPLYEAFNEELRKYVPVECGIFGADMKIDFVNDGPVTIVLDSDELM